MSGKVITRFVLTCDGGCGTQVGVNGEHESAMEARAAAYADGWRFPPKVKMNGQKSSNTSDVCPACLPTFQPEQATDTWKTKRNPDGSVGTR